MSQPQDDQQNDQQDIEKLQQELEQMTELAKRTMADLTNFKRRMDEEKAEIISFANVSLIRKLLPELDNIDRARQHLPEAAKDWFQGLEMSFSNIHKALEDSGLQPIGNIGEIFNPNLHEALLAGPGNKDEILEVMEIGYKIGDRVVRHAKVKVGNGENS